MTILGALRRRRSDGDAPGEEAAELAIRGYDNLDDRGVGARLDLLTQVELEAVEAYERAHADRQCVLDALCSMRIRLAGYDALSHEQIADPHAGAGAETVKAVRDEAA